MPYSYLQAMFCCGTLFGGIAFIILFAAILAKKRKSSRLESCVNALRDKANSWKENEIKEFDPKDALNEVDFDLMIGKYK